MKRKHRDRLLARIVYRMYHESRKAMRYDLYRCAAGVLFEWKDVSRKEVEKLLQQSIDDT